MSEKVQVTLRALDGGEVTLRQIALGHSPNVLIEFDVDDNEDVTIKIDATGPEEFEELADLFESMAEVVRAAAGIEAPGE